MLYDRSYMKKPFSKGFHSSTDKLIIILIACFVLQVIFELFTGLAYGNGSHFRFFGFSNLFFEHGYLWTLFTFPLLHQGPLHLIMSLLGLHFIARPVELELGRKNFHWLCFLSLISGAFFWICFHYSDTSSSSLSGASCFVLSSLTFFCFSNPEKPITFLLFFILPVTLKPKFLLIGILGLLLFGFVFYELRNESNQDTYSSNLGAMLAGAFVYWFLLSGRTFPSFVLASSIRKNAESSKKPSFFDKKSSLNKPSYSVDFSDQQTLQAEVDRILDKINEKGFGALSQDEKNTLDKAKGLLNKH
jgi:membrane associated rhomboid family serine protease